MSEHRRISTAMALYAASGALFEPIGFDPAAGVLPMQVQPIRKRNIEDETLEQFRARHAEMKNKRYKTHP